jgi:FemAB-related protein (PEP-CTERM system-associated)
MSTASAPALESHAHAHLRAVAPAPRPAAAVVELATSSEAWDAYVEGHPLATVYHRFAWKTVAEKAYGMRAPFLVARDAHGEGIRKGLRGVLPLIRIPRPFSPYLTTGLFGAYGPLLADDEAAARALLEAAIRRVDAGEARFLHLKLLGTAPPRQGLTVHDIWTTAQLDLSADEDADWRRLPSPMRTKIRQGQRAGLVPELGPQGLDAFYDILSENMRRKGAPIYGKAFMRVLLESLGPRADVLLLRHEGRPVSGALLAWFNGTMVVPFVSSLPSSFPLRPNNFLYWEIARRARHLGLRVLDFGSSLLGSTGLEFKLSWRPQVVPVRSHVYSSSGSAPVLAPADSALARGAVKVWSLFPAPVAQALGPTVCRWIA